MAELVWQPLNGQLGYLLDEQLRARKWKRAVMVAAFAGARGVALLLSAIAEFRTHRGEIAVYVGFDRRGTSAVALRMLLAACDQVFLVHNPDPRQIFHPKMYIFQNDDEAMVIVGSNNLTATGLYQNIEASIVVNLRLPRDQEILDTFDKQLASLPVQGVAALTEERIQELEHKGRLSHDDTETSEEGTGQEGVHEPLEGFGPQPVPPLPPMPPMPSGPRKAATTAPKIAIPRRVTVIQPKVARGV